VPRYCVPLVKAEITESGNFAGFFEWEV